MDWNSMSNDNVAQEIGKRLKTHRINKRFTQKQLAEKAGVSLFTIVQIEKGKPVSISMLIPVLRVTPARQHGTSNPRTSNQPCCLTKSKKQAC